MNRKSTNINILQFGEHLIASLRVRRSSKGLDVLQYDVERGNWSAKNGSLDDALKEFAARHNLAEDHVFSIIARHEMTARILELPSQDPAEIAGMIRLSAEEYVPFPADELIIDQCILQKLPDGRSKVLAVFAHQDVVNAHVKTLHHAQLEPEQIFLSTACLASAAIAAKQGAGRFALVNLASEGLEVVVIRDGQLEYGRAVASSQSLEDIEEELRVEIRASLAAYRRESEDGESVNDIYLASDCADVAPHCQALAPEFEQPCAPAQFVATLLSQDAAPVPALAAAPLGAALLAQDRGAVSIRLLPQSLVAARQRSDVKRKAIHLAAAGLVALAGLGIMYGQAVQQRRAYLRELRAQISRIEPAAQQIASKQKQLRILQTQVERSGSVVELMASLVDLFPPAGMNITRLIYARESGLEIYGRAENLTQVERLAQDLIDVGKASLAQFARAEQAYEHKVLERNIEVLDYKIVVPFQKKEAEAQTEENEEEPDTVE
ncbi:MAG TPA: pilus assembly protein PilM [Candidatus Bathyarchaeia archaeon]|nr:pilus assembly protein PilM [Candidatus Bathyarchaeia archaeon]